MASRSSASDLGALRIVTASRQVAANATTTDVAGLDGLLLSMADDEFVIGFSDSEWTGIAPMLEEDVAMSSLSQDELGHASALYALLAEVSSTDADALAYDREPADYRHARLLDHGRGDWAMTIARRYLYETSDAVRLQALAGGSWRPLAELTDKLQREERYHTMHIDAWFQRLARADGEPRERLLAALESLGPDAGTVFTPLPDEPALIAAGVLARPMAELERHWRSRMAASFANLDLAQLPPTVDAARGRTDHGTPFSWLHGEFTMVRRSDTGATW
jgi:ring-1,2-phenylacetyl-CoA epoxidase subunit PaaC